MTRFARLLLILTFLKLVIPGTVAGGETRTEGKVTVEGNEVSMIVVEPAQPVVLEEVASELVKEDWAACYLKCQIRRAADYEEWCANVTEEYRSILAPTEEKFTEARTRPLPGKKEGHLLYWVAAKSMDVEMLYLVEKARYTPDMPFGNSIASFKKVGDTWKRHVRDELNVVGVASISDLQELKNALESK